MTETDPIKTGIHNNPFIRAGRGIPGAEKALILIHGRGGTAEKMLGLAGRLNSGDYALFAPRATANSWYPQSLLSVPSKNEPWLSDALKVIGQLVDTIGKLGIPTDRIFFFGFSQGASLLLEFLARNATRYGGASALSGGLIGDRIYTENYKGNFQGTPFFISAGDADRHLPVERINESAAVLKEMGADTTLRLFPNQGHVVSQDQIDLANRLLFTSSI